MIVKELDPFASNDRLEKAGRKAEEQMTFHLRRAFGEDPAFLVINGLRLERDGDAAQIDHLVIHQHAVVIIESKSVTSQVRINERGEWTRWFGGSASGMQSPILQGRRQAEFLERYLKAHAEVLGKKEVSVKVRVAISDQGIIERPKDLDLDQVCKADQIPGNIVDTIRDLKMAHAMPGALTAVLGKLARGSIGVALTLDEMARLSAFLLEHHRPLVQRAVPPRGILRERPVAAPPATPTQQAAAISPARCRHCGSGDLAVEYGYNYFYRCLSCREATPINQSCATCGAKLKVRKAGARFFFDCAHCGTSTLFHINRASA